MKKGLLPALLLAAFVRPAAASDLYVTWNCLIAGDLSAGASTVLFGSVQIGADRIFDTDANFLAPDAFVGNGTNRQDGMLTIVCEIFAPEPYLIDRITVDLLGSLVPGPFAQNPRIEWTELIFDISNDEPLLLVSDAGTDASQPSTRTYDFAPVRKIRIQETFDLTGVTYMDGDEKKIDPSAIAALPIVEKHVRIVPEPSHVAGLAVGVGALLALSRRRK
ncbi:MAG: hypothetical protein AMXMBFR61_23410 [Fimbriimonadales bacterium]